MASGPTRLDFVISQGDTKPIMPIHMPPNAAGELIDLTNVKSITFLGRRANERTNPPPIRRAVESHAIEDIDGVNTVVCYVHFLASDTKAIPVPAGAMYVEMQGEVKIVDQDDEVYTVFGVDPPNDTTVLPSALSWWIRDDLGDGAVS